MALPATDTFTASSSVALETYSANWTLVHDAFYVQHVLDVLQCDGSHPAHYWNADTPNADQYTQIQLTTVGSDGIGAAVRVSSSQITYYLYYGTSSDRILRKWVNHSQTDIANAGAAASVNDTLRLEASGTTLTPKRNGSTDTAIGAQTDSSISSGSLGVGGRGTFSFNTNADNWEGGNLEGGAATAVPVFMHQLQEQGIA